jgi:hypothetical protein
MKLDLFTFAEYAANTQDNKLVVAGTFNQLTVQRAPGSDLANPGVFPLPMVYLAAVLTASIGDGLTHSAELRVVNDDGQQVLPTIELGTLTFIMNQHGRPMRFHAVIGIPGLPLPGPGEYSFELWVRGERLGETALYVDAAPGS